MDYKNNLLGTSLHTYHEEHQDDGQEVRGGDGDHLCFGASTEYESEIVNCVT